jgi:queuosine precursor transporter
MSHADAATPLPAAAGRSFRYYDFLVAGLVTVLLCSNLIGPGKVCTLSLPWIGEFSFGAGNLFFPIGYIFADVLTEVYGYARARRAIWAGFGGLVFASLMSSVILHIPASPSEPWNATLQPALEVVFGSTWRIVVASMIGYWVGDFVNSYVMARMKVWTRGRYLWTRTIGSTVCGQGVDSLLFYPIAFYGVWTNDALLAVIGFNFVFKLMVEVLFTPVTYWVVARLKHAEGVDVYDTHTRFTPFSLREDGEIRRAA